MGHQDELVVILNKEGEVVGSKPRKELNKRTDIHHTVFVQLITPDKKLVMAQIPQREDLPNLYPYRWGTTMATIVRVDESALGAATRGLKRELHFQRATPELLGEKMLQLPDGVHIKATCYRMTSEVPRLFSEKDIAELRTRSLEQVRDLVDNHPAMLTPTFIELWTNHLHEAV
ncbi:MAG TPA: hypothetical protein VFO38_01260 [Candidatus Saccharimonadales bacterium]|nr:hypothetical protein [Candidatus Saccharimonadales bacterium]